MKHIGLICPAVSGHLNPMTTLGRELKARGHQVSVFCFLDGKAKVQTAGLDYVPIGQTELPEGRGKFECKAS